MLKHTALLLVSTSALAACGAGTVRPFDAFTPDTAVIGTTLQETTINEVAQDDIYVNALLDRGVFEGIRNDGFTKLGYVGTSTSGGSTALAIGSQTEAPHFGATAFQRNVETTAPEEGTATYTGDYVGVLRHLYAGAYYDPYETNSTPAMVGGNVTLTADFDTSEISGLITERGWYDPEDGTRRDIEFNDLTLEITDIKSDNSFSGTATGGEAYSSYVSPEDGTASDGQYRGLISGDTGQETVGGVSLRQNYGNQNYLELGVFIAE